MLSEYQEWNGANITLVKAIDAVLDALRWRKVEEELPKVDDENISDKYLLKGYYKIENHKSAISYIAVRINDDIWETFKVVEFETAKNFITTHWLPIPRKEED